MPEPHSLLNKFEETCCCKTIQEVGVATLQCNGRNLATEDKGQQRISHFAANIWHSNKYAC